MYNIILIKMKLNTVGFLLSFHKSGICVFDYSFVCMCISPAITPNWASTKRVNHPQCLSVLKEFIYRRII